MEKRISDLTSGPVPTAPKDRSPGISAAVKQMRRHTFNVSTKLHLFEYKRHKRP